MNNQTFDVEVLDDPRQPEVRVKIDGETFAVYAETVTERLSLPTVAGAETLAPAAPTPANAAGVVKAPLPGVIKSIAVRQGQHVNPNDELLVIEAMKAMNVIRATRPGTIGKILVAEGRQIAYGAPLLELA
ncbi:MAG: acetyl-CoA carboxylase biotin carboxyl carrier protein subunit [Chloroflexi bacterium]|nr:acetyl-CoA carboxylase biotin carboxyl carrier protein subunit [Chloroflexota bacterium]